MIRDGDLIMACMSGGAGNNTYGDILFDRHEPGPVLERHRNRIRLDSA